MERVKIVSTVIIFMFIGLLITSCENSGDSENNGNNKMNDMYGNEKSALTVRINNTIERIDKKIEELENRLDKSTEETRKIINDKVDKLKERKVELRENLRDLNDKSDNMWEKFKADVNEAIDDTEAWINDIDIDLNNNT